MLIQSASTQIDDAFHQAPVTIREEAVKTAGNQEISAKETAQREAAAFDKARGTTETGQTAVKPDEVTIKGQQASTANERIRTDTTEKKTTAFKNNRAEPQKKLTQQDIEDLQKKLPDTPTTRFTFKFDEKSKEMVVQVIDKKTDRVIRQIPPEEFLKIKMAFKELMRGTLLDKKA
ncbi:MAG: flagellar protein FlaG [Dissulfuribacterales bacterium]